MKRHLFIIGAQRSGTALLAQGLARHRDLVFAEPMRPEPKYFLKPDDEVGAEDYEARYFANLPDTVLRAEKSTSYIEHTAAARRMVRVLASVRCIALLRDPVERAVSNYWFSVEHGFETRPPEEALDPASQTDAEVPGLSVSPFAYLQRGRYVGYLDAYGGVVGADNLLVLQTERLVHDEGSWAEVYRFLQLEPKQAPSTRDRVNAAHRKRPVADATLNDLTAYYAADNAALATTYPVDLALWRHSA